MKGGSGFGCLRAAAFVACVTGCTGGTETGNPPFVAALAYTGTSSSPEEYGVGQRGAVATVQSAWLDLEAAELSADGSCGGNGPPLVVPALGVGDHAAGAHVETTFEARPGSFCSFTLPFARARSVPVAAPRELQGRSVLLLGELADGTPFRVASRAEPSIQLRANAKDIELSSEDASLLVVFDFAAWLRAVPFEDAAKADGELVVDDAHNAELLLAFEEALGAGVSLYRDPNADGVLDDASELVARPQ